MDVCGTQRIAYELERNLHNNIKNDGWKSRCDIYSRWFGNWGGIFIRECRDWSERKRSSYKSSKRIRKEVTRNFKD